MPNILTHNNFKETNCKNCYKCIRYCPVKAIRFRGNRAHIIQSECILCGQCYVVCPQNDMEIKSDLERVQDFLSSGRSVIASIDPAFIANYDGVGIESLCKTLKAMGFSRVEETAYGVTIVKNEYERMLKEGDRDIVISSCCHPVNLLIQKYFPSQLRYLADVYSPMQAHCMDIKRRYPEAKTVHICSCIAKKDEAEKYKGIVDAVLTFEELTGWFRSLRITPEEGIVASNESLARIFPTTGGLLKTMTKSSEYTYLAIDGVKNCYAALCDIESGRIHKCFIEMSACTGSCIGGPCMENSSSVKNYVAVSNYAGKEDFKVPQPPSEDLRKSFKLIEKYLRMPQESEILEVLSQMGKSRLEEQLNCGACGYDTCREHAIAILHGKSEMALCLPYLKEKAESFSDSIVDNMPNGLMVLNEKLEVQQLNAAALTIMDLANESEILGKQINEFLAEDLFQSVLENKEDLHNHRVYLEKYKRYVEQTVIHDDDYHLLICILRDRTDEETERQKKESISRQTVEIADKVVEKQMRIVQEIASLLGETAAETKIALTKLKESISDE